MIYYRVVYDPFQKWTNDIRHYRLIIVDSFQATERDGTLKPMHYTTRRQAEAVKRRLQQEYDKELAK